ncbi:MAG: DUF2848 family protein [Promethearchaeota archaeon]
MIVKRLCFGRHCSRDTDSTRISLDLKRAEGYTVHGNPNICMTSRYLLTNDDVIEVQGPQTSGEVEIVAIVDKDDILISVGSDNNDHSIKTMWTETLGKVYDTAKSKQMVPAVLAKHAWRYEEVKAHWDRLILKSFITLSGEKIPYQNFTLSDLVDLEYHYRTNPWLKEDGVFFFGGTSNTLSSVPSKIYKPAIGGEIFPSDFHFEMFDPVLNRKISHSYNFRFLEDYEGE